MYRRGNKGLAKHMDFIILDLLCLQAAYLIASCVRHGGAWPFGSELYENLVIVFSLTQLFVSIFNDSFKNVLRRGYYREAVAALKHVCLVILIVTLYLFAARSGSNYSRLVLFATAVMYYIFTYVMRCLWKAYLESWKKTGNERSLVVLTTRDMAEGVLRGLKEGAYGRIKVVGVALMDGAEKNPAITNIRDEVPALVGDDPEDERSAPERTEGIREAAATAEKVVRIAGGTADAVRESGGETAGQKAVRCKEWEGSRIAGIPVVADGTTLADYVCGEWVDEVFISLPRRVPFPDKLYDELVSMGVTVHLRLLRAMKLDGQKQSIERMGDYTVLSSSINMVPAKQLLYKRMLDIAGGLVGCFLTVLIALVVGPAIYIQSPGPIFFTQERVGMNGRKFKIYKFRSMYLDAEERKRELMAKNNIKDGMMFKMDDDPRVIGGKKGVGGIIRRFSLDEFPQFWNVLKGEMSLVGTRPPTVEEWEKYDLHHRVRLATKPGITGMWQVSGRSKITDFEEVVKLDKKYIMEWSIGLDIKILFKTVAVVLGSEGAM